MQRHSTRFYCHLTHFQRNASGGMGVVDLALSKLGGAAFVVTMPSRQHCAWDFLANVLFISPHRIIVIPAVNASMLTSTVLDGYIANGSFDEQYVKGSLAKNIFSGRKRSYASFFSTTRAATTLSHLRAHRAFLASSFKVALFLEDDVGLSTRWDYTGGGVAEQRRLALSVLHDALLTAPIGWELLWLGYCFEQCRPQNQFVASNLSGLVFVRSLEPKCLHGYVATRSASKALLKAILPLSSVLDADGSNHPSLAVLQPVRTETITPHFKPKQIPRSCTLPHPCASVHET